METNELYCIHSPKSQSSTFSYAPTSPLQSNNSKQTVSAFSSLADLKARQRILTQKFNCNVGTSECVYEVVPGAHKRVHSCEPSEADYKLLGLYTPNIDEIDDSDDSSSDTRDPNELMYSHEKTIHDRRAAPCVAVEEYEFLEDDSNFNFSPEIVNSYSHDLVDDISEVRVNSSGRNFNTSGKKNRKKRKPNLKKMRRKGRMMVSTFWKKVRPVFSKAKKMFIKKEVSEFKRAKGTLL
jgi:hypothetical protein